MNVTLTFTKLDSTPSIQKYVETKLGSLSKFMKKLDPHGEGELHVELARTTKHHKSGPVFKVSAHLKTSTRVFRAEDQNFDIRTAVDKVRDKLRLLLERHHDLAVDKERHGK